MAAFITAELAAVGLAAHTFDEGALQVIQRAVQDNDVAALQRAAAVSATSTACTGTDPPF